MGARRMFQASIVIFLIGSILSGLTESMMQLILFRGVQGLGAGGLMSLPMAIIGDILSPRQRGRYQGYMVGVFSLSSIAGPAIGGFFTQNLSWRWCFYVNIPIGIVALIVTSSVLNLPFQKIAAPHRLSGRRPAHGVGGRLAAGDGLGRHDLPLELDRIIVAARRQRHSAASSSSGTRGVPKSRCCRSACSATP